MVTYNVEVRLEGQEHGYFEWQFVHLPRVGEYLALLSRPNNVSKEEMVICGTVSRIIHSTIRTGETPKAGFFDYIIICLKEIEGENP